jgi:hypothetical protein
MMRLITIAAVAHCTLALDVASRPCSGPTTRSDTATYSLCQDDQGVKLVARELASSELIFELRLPESTSLAEAPRIDSVRRQLLVKATAASDVVVSLASRSLVNADTDTMKTKTSLTTLLALAAAASAVILVVAAMATQVHSTRATAFDNVGNEAPRPPAGCCERFLANFRGSGKTKGSVQGEGGVALVEGVVGYDSDDDATFAAQCAAFDSKKVATAYTTAGMMTNDAIGDDQL